MRWADYNVAFGGLCSPKFSPQHLSVACDISFLSNEWSACVERNFFDIAELVCIYWALRRDWNTDMEPEMETSSFTNILIFIYFQLWCMP